MGLSIKQTIKQAKEYVEMEASTKVTDVTFVQKFSLLGQEDFVVSVKTTDKDEPEWWVVGGSTPMNLYSKSNYHTADEVFSLHTGLMLRLSARNIKQPRTKPGTDSYDAFISHASEDKTSLVRPLARELERLGFRVWYDEFELKVGDSLRKSIDKGLANSRYGIVILSKSFFEKNWPQYELNGLTAREMEKHKVILPVWHNITKEEVLSFSPTLADKIAVITTGKTIVRVAKTLAEALNES
jgi:TIR domain